MYYYKNYLTNQQTNKRKKKTCQNVIYFAIWKGGFVTRQCQFIFLFIKLSTLFNKPDFSQIHKFKFLRTSYIRKQIIFVTAEFALSHVSLSNHSELYKPWQVLAFNKKPFPSTKTNYPSFKTNKQQDSKSSH